MIAPLVWEEEDGLYYTGLGNGPRDYNFDTTTRNQDEPIIVYIGTGEADAENCWTVEQAQAAANAHHRAAIMAAFNGEAKT